MKANQIVCGSAQTSTDSNAEKNALFFCCCRRIGFAFDNSKRPCGMDLSLTLRSKYQIAEFLFLDSFVSRLVFHEIVIWPH